MEVTTLHVIRDCNKEAIVWKNIVLAYWFANFMIIEKEEWFNFNLNNKQSFHVRLRWVEVWVICY